MSFAKVIFIQITMTEDNKWVETPQSEQLDAFKFSTGYLRIRFKKNTKDLYITLDIDEISDIVESTPTEISSHLSDQCIVCNHGTSSFITLERTDSTGSTFEDRVPMHTSCHTALVSAVNEIRKDYSDELTINLI